MNGSTNLLCGPIENTLAGEYVSCDTYQKYFEDGLSAYEHSSVGCVDTP